MAEDHAMTRSWCGWKYCAALSWVTIYAYHN